MQKNTRVLPIFVWNLQQRVSQPAGFELGSGMYINASIPEKSAEFLRNINAG